ncbi:hypothetical protein A9R05_39745 (plasmid) [Burkholderia sp. KK1]|nr:hypothetical protein A9R05_39745 [Burkholderia sp. KK1]
MRVYDRIHGRLIEGLRRRLLTATFQELVFLGLIGAGASSGCMVAGSLKLVLLIAQRQWVS